MNRTLRELIKDLQAALIAERQAGAGEPGGHGVVGGDAGLRSTTDCEYAMVSNAGSRIAGQSSATRGERSDGLAVLPIWWASAMSSAKYRDLF